MVSQPGTLSLIEMGWIYNKGRKMAVEECDIQPWNLGEAGRDPSDYGFRFKAGGEWFNVQVRFVDYTVSSVVSLHINTSSVFTIYVKYSLSSH